MPQVFAVCEFERDEDGELASGSVFAWGMLFADHAEVASSISGMYGSFGSMNRVLDALSSFEEVGLVWPDATQRHDPMRPDRRTRCTRAGLGRRSR